MSDPGCFFHGNEPITPDHARICGECGHAFTAAELITLDKAIRLDARGGDDYDAVQPRTVDEIEVCPMCAHDF